MTDYAIKIVEQILPIADEIKSFQLFSKSTIVKHQKKYNFLHIRLVQIGVKPLTREGLNIIVLLSLRDKRHMKYLDSILGNLEMSLCNGPVYFNCFPNFSLGLRDPHILKALTLDVKTSNFKMIPGSQNIAILTRIYTKQWPLFLIQKL